MLKVGVIGTGTMGRFHTFAYSQIQDTKVVACSDPRFDVCKEVAAQFQAQCVKDPEEIISNPEIDLIDICTPTPFHKEYTLKAVKAGKHVFCEKPLAKTLAEAEAMAKVIKTAKVKFVVGHVLRFFPEFVVMKQMIDQGKIGKPGVVRTSRMAGFPRASNDWYANFSMSGGVIQDMIIHDFDWLNWVFGEPKRVFAHGLINSGYDHLDYALVTIRYKNGVIAHVEGSWAQPGGFYVKVEATGDKGQLDYIMGDTMPVNMQQRKTDKSSVGVAVPESPLTEDPYTSEIRHFVNCILNDTKPAVTIDEAIAALKVSLAAIESIKTGQPVNL